jgi:hypothetical protein
MRCDTETGTVEGMRTRAALLTTHAVLVLLPTLVLATMWANGTFARDQAVPDANIGAGLLALWLLLLGSPWSWPLLLADGFGNTEWYFVAAWPALCTLVVHGGATTAVWLSRRRAPARWRTG